MSDIDIDIDIDIVVNCTLCHRVSDELLHCSHHSAGGVLRRFVCPDCRHAIHLAGVFAGDEETIKYIKRQAEP